MLYLAMTFWLLMLVLTAWGVHALWSSLLKPRVVNSLLLPGTLVAQVGHVVGCLITGATVENTTLIKDEESAEPETTQKPKPKLPLIGPIVIAMLPLLTCAAALAYVMRELGPDVVMRMGEPAMGMVLPSTMAEVWQMLRDAVTLMERTVNAVMAGGLRHWHSGLFIYLVICLTVRMAPLPGTLRGAVGAIVVLGLVSAVFGQLFPSMHQTLLECWTVLSFAVAVLLFLLLLSLLIRGVLGLAKLMATSTA